jgi:hypothetical protein
MSSKDGTSNKEREESFFMLQAIQQQFERMNVVFNEIWVWMDRQDAVIATWREGHPQRVPNARRQERCAHVDDFDDDHDDEFKDEDDQALNGDGRFMPRGEKGMVEVSKEIQDGKMGLIET